MGHTRIFAWVGRNLFHPIDNILYKLTGGRILSSGPPILPTLLLTTTGKRSGKERVSPLLYLKHGDELVVVGSNFGQKHHPAWSENLLANPGPRVQVGSHTGKYQARLAKAEEKDTLWPNLLEIWPAYDTYTGRSSRDIRVFILSPEE